MAQLGKKIHFSDSEKISKVNNETLQLWKKYKVDMTLRELSQNTIDAYYNDLTHLWIYTLDNFDNVSIKELSEDQLTEFFYYCKTEGNNSRRVKRRMSSIAAFYKFLRKKKLIAENPMEYIDRPKKDTDVIAQTFLTKEQVEYMFSCLQDNVDNSKTDLAKNKAIRLKCYAVLSMSTMARVTAISTLRWEQVDFEERTINEVLEKEGKLVTLYFSEYAKECLLELKSHNESIGFDDFGYIFPSRVEGQHVSSTTLSEWCKSIGKMIDIDSLHPHDFRHSGSQIMKLNGASVEDISALLNHSGTDVTIKHYLRVDKKKVQQTKDEFGI